MKAAIRLETHCTPEPIPNRPSIQPKGVAPNSEEGCPFKEAGLGIEPSRASHAALNGFAARGPRQPPLRTSVILSESVDGTLSSGASHAKGIVDRKVSEAAAGKTALSGCRGRNHKENECLPRSLGGSAPKIRGTRLRSEAIRYMLPVG